MKEQKIGFALAPIAIAVLTLAAGAAQAQTELKIGGKFDAGYQFKRTAATDSITDGSCGSPTAACYLTTETQGDGSASTSRITIQANETISPSLSAFIDLDLRFTNIHEGKNTATNGGLNANDKKIMGIKGSFGKLAWGTYNIVNLSGIADKPYMTNIRDIEFVKFGISKPRSSDLTNRVTEYVTPILTLGPVKMLAKANYAFGDQHKDGSNDGNLAASPNNTIGSGDASAVGYELSLGSEATFGYHIVKRAASAYGDAANGSQLRDGMTYSETSVVYKPGFAKGLKLSTSYFVEKGYNPNQTAALGYDGTAFKAKGMNYVVSYNWDKLWAVGLEVASNKDLGSNRNSGRGFMFGGMYMLSPSVYVYGAVAKSDFERNTSIAGGKYDGTKVGFKDTLTLRDERYTRFGIVKEF
ncbi:hypothetical protein GCM10027046_08980 [Uliginosibacterium flavum]|uniref:Porin n=1 Tax=Uliginosibacterium flavum TaxID=1396831 RepID=A0ABV2TI93_9RHOO